MVYSYIYIHIYIYMVYYRLFSCSDLLATLEMTLLLFQGLLDAR